MFYVRCVFTRVFRSKTLKQCRFVAQTLFKKHLLFTNVGISMSLSALGDVIQQNYEITQGDHERWNGQRTYHMSITGLTVGVLCHHTYHYLEVLFPGSTLRAVMKKVVVDQLVCSPLCIGLFFLTIAILEKSDYRTFKEEVIQKAWRLYAAEWLIWPPAQVINFYFIPPRFRVLYDNTISLGFDIYTSYVKHEIPLEKD